MKLRGANFSDGCLLEVGWVDIAAHTNIHDVRAADTCEAVNVGWVVNVAGGVMRLASGIYPGTTTGDVVAIPVSVIRSVRVIERKRRPL